MCGVVSPLFIQLFPRGLRRNEKLRCFSESIKWLELGEWGALWEALLSSLSCERLTLAVEALLPRMRSSLSRAHSCEVSGCV